LGENQPIRANRPPTQGISPKADNFQYFLMTKPVTKNQFYISQNAQKTHLRQCIFSNFHAGNTSKPRFKCKEEGARDIGREEGEGE